jgi:hypothetical protein
MTDAVIGAGARTPIGLAAPFSESWPAWRPDPWWDGSELPADWDVVQA